MAEKIAVKHLTKVFGRKPRSILKRLKQGQSKEKILAETGHTVGLYDVSFSVKEGEVFVIMGLSGSGEIDVDPLLEFAAPTYGRQRLDRSGRYCGI